MRRGVLLTSYFLTSPFSYLGLSLLIHKMECLATMTSKAPRWRPEHSSLAAEASRDGMEPERGSKSCNSKTRRRLVQGRGGREQRS